MTVTDQAGLSSSDRVKLRVGEGNEAYTYTQVSQENGAYFLASFAQGGIAQTNTATRKVGDKKYELKDHLGNMWVVIGDEKKAEINGTNVTLKVALRNYSNYYAFGMEMPGGSWSMGAYRYGFNGKENDAETGWQDYGLRLYKPELAKFLSTDPLSKAFPCYSPYHFAGNSPIVAIDLDGGEIRFHEVDWNTKSGKTVIKKTVSQNHFYVTGTFTITAFKYIEIDLFDIKPIDFETLGISEDFVQYEGQWKKIPEGFTIYLLKTTLFGMRVKKVSIIKAD